MRKVNDEYDWDDDDNNYDDDDDNDESPPLPTYLLCSIKL